jgi:hypothetical protein
MKGSPGNYGMEPGRKEGFKNRISGLEAVSAPVFNENRASGALVDRLLLRRNSARIFSKG